MLSSLNCISFQTKEFEHGVMIQNQSTQSEAQSESISDFVGRFGEMNQLWWTILNCMLHDRLAVGVKYKEDQKKLLVELEDVCKGVNLIWLW